MSDNRYEITRLLGKGRTGGVYEAEDKNLNRKVAMRRFFDQGNQFDFAQHKEDFLQVARSLGNLQHPNLLRVFDAGVDEDGGYVVSQLLEGESLHEETKKGAMPLDTVLELAKQMLDAFSMAHDIGYFHGALTPDSILMVPRARGGYRYVILDMGLSRLAPLIQGKDSFLAVMADRAILSPELFDGGTADARADLYMLGQILYMCIAGGHPIGGLSVEEARKKHLKGLPSIKKYNNDVSRGMAEWLSILIAVDPADRPTSAVEALRTLQQISSGIADTSAQKILSGLVSVREGDGNGSENQDGSGPVPILPPGMKPEDITKIPTQKNNKKPLIAAVTGGIIVAIIVGLMLMSGNDEVTVESDNATPSSSSDVLEPDVKAISEIKEEITPEVVSPEVPKPKVVESVNNEPPVEIKERLIYFDGKTADHQGWDFTWPSSQRLNTQGLGWSIQDENNFTGLRYPLLKHSNKMLDQGWHLTYKFYAGSGNHRIGFTINDAENPGWLGGGDVSCCVVVKSEGEKVILYSPEDENYTLPEVNSYELDIKDAKKEITITIEQEPEATTGEYVVKLNGSKIYKTYFSNKINYPESKNWTNHLFCSTLDKKSKASWVIEEIKLEAL